MGSKGQDLAEQEALAEIRDQIDVVDLQLLEMLNRRARLAQSVADVKLRSGTQDAVFYRPEREAKVLKRMISENTGPIPNSEIARLFREVMSTCLALEDPLDVVFFGPDLLAAHQATNKQFGLAVDARALGSAKDLFVSVSSGESDYGIVLIDDPIDGIKMDTLSLFLQSDLSICGEVEISDSRPIGGSLSFEDSMSRFWVVGTQPVAACGSDKTTLLIGSDGKACSAVLSLESLQKCQLRSTLIELGDQQAGGHETLILVELEGHIECQEIKALISDLEAIADDVKPLGSYPIAVI